MLSTKLILRFIGFVLITMCSLDSFSQTFERKQVLIEHSGSLLQNPLVGGLLSPQFSQADLDGDGKLDLVVFDRVGDVILPFLNQGGVGEIDYQFAPQYIDDFPMIKNWMLLRDYNNDSIMDIFCSPSQPGIASIEVHKGSRSNGRLSFELVQFDDKSFDVLYIMAGSGEVPIYVSVLDKPDIADVDGDGDLDILSFEPAGGRVSLFQNMTVERGLSLDSLQYTWATACYGKFFESGFSEEISLGTQEECSSGLTDGTLSIRHAGSSISIIDIDSDSLVDLLIGDLSNEGIVFLKNTGFIDDAWMSQQETDFPQYDVPVDIDIFNSAFVMDINNDGKNDLIVAPNEKNTAQSKDHVWLYLNVSDTDEMVFELYQEDFLAESIIGVGLLSNPCFFDHNGDGLLDILVGTSGHIGGATFTNARLHLYQNIGTASTPKYRLVDEDYLGFSQYAGQVANLAPTTGDMDGDGDIDLLVGTDKGYFFYLENGSGDASFLLKSSTYMYQELRVGQHSKPELFDVNGDGLLDLIIGERSFNSEDGILGSLNYLQNVGTPTEPRFTAADTGHNTQVLGQIYTKEPGFINNYAHPVLIDKGENFLVLVATADGSIEMYRGSNLVKDRFEKLTDKIGNIYEGNRSSLDIADIDNDQFYELIVGNQRGGIALYDTDISTLTTSVSSPISDLNILISPNPFDDYLKFDNMPEGKSIRVEIVRFDGSVMFISVQNGNFVLDTNTWPTGAYVIRFSNEAGQWIEKTLKIKN